MGWWLTNPTRNHKVAASIPGLAQWVKDPCCELWCRSQTWLQPGVVVAVAQASSYGYSFDSTPSLGTSTCCGCGPEKKKKKFFSKKNKVVKRLFSRRQINVTPCLWLEMKALCKILNLRWGWGIGKICLSVLCLIPSPHS